MGRVHKNIGTKHYYTESLVKANIYTEEELSGVDVYTLYYNESTISHSVCLIDKDIVLVKAYLPVVLNYDEKMVNRYIKAYINFYDMMEMDEDLDISNIEYNLSIGLKNCEEDDIDEILWLLDVVDSLPCNDPLWNRMDKDLYEWCNYEEFDMTEYLNQLKN